MKKHNFLLLEVMVGIAILILCVMPFALSPLKKHQSLMNAAVNLELQRRSTLIASDIKEKLYLREIKVEGLKEERITLKTDPFYNKNYQVVIPDLFNKKFDERVYIALADSKVDKTERHYLVKLVIYFVEVGKSPKLKDPHFEYLFTVSQETHQLIESSKGNE